MRPDWAMPPCASMSAIRSSVTGSSMPSDWKYPAQPKMKSDTTLFCKYLSMSKPPANSAVTLVSTTASERESTTSSVLTRLRPRFAQAIERSDEPFPFPVLALRGLALTSV